MIYYLYGKDFLDKAIKDAVHFGNCGYRVSLKWHADGIFMLIKF